MINSLTASQTSLTAPFNLTNNSLLTAAFLSNRFVHLETHSATAGGRLSDFAVMTFVISAVICLVCMKFWIELLSFSLCPFKPRLLFHFAHFPSLHPFYRLSPNLLNVTHCIFSALSIKYIKMVRFCDSSIMHCDVSLFCVFSDWLYLCMCIGFVSLHKFNSHAVQDLNWA